MSEPGTVHPLPLRLMHWVNVLAMLLMIGSGWQIYNASPLFAWRFPAGITLGGWLAAGLRWHFAGMWLLAGNGLAWIIYGSASGHFRRRYLPLSLSSLRAALADALHLRLQHPSGSYNPLQRAAYLGVLLLAAVLLLSGLGIWKPVQLQELTALFGGYDAARYWHFLAMSALLLFLVVHLTMVALLPSTLLTMISGRAPQRQEKE